MEALIVFGSIGAYGTIMLDIGTFKQRTIFFTIVALVLTGLVS